MDREDTLRRAEKLLRQGRLEAAIAEYARLVDDQPGDWATANLLGDLYVRAGQIERAVTQYARIADQLARDGFLSKATALYKKIVKIHPEDDTALLRAADLAAQQGLSADARGYLHALFQQRLRRSDRAGAAKIAYRLAEVDPHDAVGRLEAARMLAELGAPAEAAEQLRAAGHVLCEAGKVAEGIRAWREALRFCPTDGATRSELVKALVGLGDPDTAARDVARSAADWRAVADGL
ncbi:MAG: tetratricopeptide repeat protein, partial [Acidobacteria bacterium]|nr:tetratricopeptide repeat protein [Acidobacteriota bacterium]